MTEVNETNETIVMQPMTPAAPTPQGKTFSEDYVHTIREEAKENRIARKAAETKAKESDAKLKALIGLNDDDSLDDAKIAEYQVKQAIDLTAAVQKANARLIKAEIKSLDGYDSKLVERLLDKSKIEIDDDGTVTGLTEAVEALAVEFPLIKVSKTQRGANPPLEGKKTVRDELNDLREEVKKHPGDSALMQEYFRMKERLNN